MLLLWFKALCKPVVVTLWLLTCVLFVHEHAWGVYVSGRVCVGVCACVNAKVTLASSAPPISINSRAHIQAHTYAPHPCSSPDALCSGQEEAWTEATHCRNPNAGNCEGQRHGMRCVKCNLRSARSRKDKLLYVGFPCRQAAAC